MQNLHNYQSYLYIMFHMKIQDVIGVDAALYSNFSACIHLDFRLV